MQSNGIKGLPWWLHGKESTWLCRRCVFDPCCQEDPLEKRCQPTPELLPVEFYGQRSLASYSPWGSRRVGQDLATKHTQ